MSGLSNQMIDVLTLIEQMFWETGEIPTNEFLVEQTQIGRSTVEGYWKNTDFRAALAARGVTFDNTASIGRALSMEQLLVANMVMNIHDRRSMREKLKDPVLEQFKITPQKFNAWMRQPAFQDHLMKRASTLFEHAKPAAYRELVKAVEAGDPQMLKFFFEITGIYNPKVTVEIDVNVVLVRVVEIIAKHVKDPITLQAIAAELEALDTGPEQAPQAVPLPIPKAIPAAVSLLNI